ncbi:MAG TPA: hotdog fold domain-containing protein [Solirubrobacterales bacterium]|jgi:3-aminobutyryl-CoA ammonia-lyase|nr:hotdog fold domain-containing protein [Solirubrobacterales bacterium]
MPSSASLRVFMSQQDVHYDGGLVDGARVLGLFGDAGTALLLENDGVEGLLACYEEIQFLRPVFAGDTVDVLATLESSGRTSRRIRFEASVAGEPIATATAVAVAKPLEPSGGA